MSGEGTPQTHLAAGWGRVWPWLAPLLAALLVFTLRAVNVGPSWDIHVDEITYLNIAQSLASRGLVWLYGAPFYLHPPAFFYLEAAWLKLLHPPADPITQIYALRTLNAVIAGLSAGLLLLLGRRIGGWGAGVTAALIFALDPFVARINGQTLLETATLFWVLLGWTVLFLTAGLERGARLGGWRVLGAGLVFGVALLTKDLAAFVTLLPLAVSFAARWALARADAARVAALALLCYATYPLSALLRGEWTQFIEQKFSGLQRFAGIVKTTGFKRAGGPSLLEAVLANLSTYGSAYLLAVTGLIALLLLLRLGAPLRRLLAAWVGSAYLLVAFAVLIGTLEEQFFYFLSVAATLATAVALAWVLRPTARRTASLPIAALAGVAFIAWTGAVWVQVHLTPSNGYERLRAYLRDHVALGSLISTTTEESQFLTGGYTTGIWTSSSSLQRSGAQYVILSTQQVQRGYGSASPEFLAWLQQHATLAFSTPSRSYGALNLYRVPRELAAAAGGAVIEGRDHWLFLPTEYNTDPADQQDPRASTAYPVGVIGTIARLLKARGITTELLLVPTKARVYKDRLPDFDLVPPVIEGRYARALTALHVQGVLAPDLAAPLSRAARLGPPLYFRYDHHWTPQGARVAAQAAAQAARARVDLSGLAPLTSRVQSGPAQPAPLRSLLNRLPASQRVAFPPEQLHPYRITASARAGADLPGTEDIGVTLVGSSFSQIPSLQFAPLLSHALSRDVLNVSESALGPWRPMLDYLRSDAFHKTPGKLLVWEFWEHYLWNQGEGVVPIDYLLDAGASILNGCNAANSAVTPTTGPEVGQFAFSVERAAQPIGSYLHLRLKAPDTAFVMVEFLAGEQRVKTRVSFPNDGAPHDLNLPVYAIAGEHVQTLRLSTGQPDAQVQGAQLCSLPSGTTDSTYLRTQHLDLLNAQSPAGMRVSGLGELESTGFRWGLAQASTLEFFSASERQLSLSTVMRSPIANQRVQVLANGKLLHDTGRLGPDERAELQLTVPVHMGLNQIEFRTARQNHRAGTFAPRDPRPISVEFLRLQLDQR